MKIGLYIPVYNKTTTDFFNKFSEGVDNDLNLLKEQGHELILLNSLNRISDIISYSKEIKIDTLITVELSDNLLNVHGSDCMIFVYPENKVAKDISVSIKECVEYGITNISYQNTIYTKNIIKTPIRIIYDLSLKNLDNILHNILLNFMKSIDLCNPMLLNMNQKKFDVCARDGHTIISTTDLNLATCDCNKHDGSIVRDSNGKTVYRCQLCKINPMAQCKHTKNKTPFTIPKIPIIKNTSSQNKF